MEVRRRIVWDGQLAPEPTTPVVNKPSYQAPKAQSQPVLASAPVQVTVTKIGSNGHKSEFIRKMTADEKKAIRKWWLNRSGCCGWDDVVEFRKEHMPPEVAIFQVVGFITTLHKALAKGEETISDLTKYNEHRKARGQSIIKVKSVINGPVHPKFVALARKVGSVSRKYTV